MTRQEEPSQSDVLRARFSRVPWRSVLSASIRERRGSGPTALPDRLEGAVLGCLAAGGPSGGPSSSPSSNPSGGQSGSESGSESGSPRLLAVLEALLDAAPIVSRAEETADLLPFPLVLRGSDDAALVAAVTGSDPWAGTGDPVPGALFALVVRRLLAGERRRGAALDRAARAIRTTLPAAASRVTAGTSPRDGFRAGWEAFARSESYPEAVERARAAAPDPGPAAVAGSLAGLYWGSAAVPSDWRRSLPDHRRVRVLVDRLVETDAPGWDGRPWRTTTSSPLRLDALDLSGLGLDRGSAGITFLPGRRYVGYHTGAHWRDLDADAERLRELGVDTLLLLVEDAELVRCRVTGIGEAMAAHGVELTRFPIRDPLLPRDAGAFRRTVGRLLDRIRAGESVAVACRGGLDRAGMTSACLLREAGLDAGAAIERVQRARRGALTLPDQQAFVRAWPPRP